MQRRELVKLLGGAAAAWPFAAPALAGPKIPRIGFVGASWQQTDQRFLDAFRDGLRTLGWAEGGNVAIIDRGPAKRDELLPGLFAEMIGAGVDLIVTVGTQATLAATRATTKIPIVFVAVGDPAASGIVDPAQPGGNATGLTLTTYGLITKRLQLLAALAPGMGRVAVIAREDPGSEQRWEEIRANADEMAIEVLAIEATTGKAIERAFTVMRSARCDAIYEASGPLGPDKRARIISLAAASRLPAIYPFREFAAEGGLLALVTDYNDLFHRAAGFADKILNGAKPAGLPVEPPVKFTLTVNLKTAQALGLTIPAAVLARADELIE
jgi:putative ABC transport system substrate-binding protein